MPTSKPFEPAGGTILDQIGRYKVIGELGRGAMGRVYLAHDPNIGRKIALKVLQPSIRVAPEAEEEFQKRFVLEARAVGRLNHPGIVAIYDAGIDPATRLAFIAMELVEGVSLAEILKEREELTVETAAEIVAVVAKALAYAHSQGVVHRDVKPANILVAKDGRVKVLDFGIAKLTAESHTMDGQVLGTPAYMSPEQVQGQPLDGRSDVFSLGAVLYQCVAGEGPFRGDTVAAIIHEIMTVDPRPPLDPEEEIPGDFWAVITRALAKDPQERFETGRELAKALDPFRPSTIDSRPVLESLLPVVVQDPPETPPTGGEQAATPRTFAFTLGGTRVGGEVSPSPPSGPTSTDRSTKKRLVELWPQHWRWILPALAVVILLAVVAQSTGPPASPRPALGERHGPSGPPSEPDQSEEHEGGGDAEPADAEPNGERAAVPGETTLVVLHENRLKSATMTIWIDGEQVWSNRIFAGGSLFDRVRGRTVRATVPVSPGEHAIEVRVTGAKKKVDAVETTRGRFREGRTRYLRVRLIPGLDDLVLDWE